MLIIELAIEGVGPFSQILKIPFREGLNLVLGGNDSGKSIIYRCLLSFFDFDNDYRSLINNERPEVSRAALTVKAKEGDVYRLYRDFVRDEKAIYKYNYSLKKFEPQGKDGAYIKEFLKNEAGDVPLKGVTNLFAINSTSLQGFSLPFNSPMEDKKSSWPEETGGDNEENTLKAKRLNELKGIMARADELTKVESQIDEIQGKITDTKKRLETIRSVDKGIKELTERIEPLQGCEDLPADTPSMIARYDEKEKKKKEEMEKLIEERSIEEEELKTIDIRPFFTSPLFITGVIVTSLALLAPAFIDLYGILQQINFLGFLLGLGIIGYALFKDFQKGMKKKKKEELINSLKKQEESLKIRYEKDNATFIEMLNKTSSKDAQELNIKFKKLKELSRERDYLIEKKRGLLDGKDLQTLEMEYSNFTKAKEDLEEKVKGYRGMSANLYEIEAEIARLEREIHSNTESSIKYEPERFIPGMMNCSPLPLDIELLIDRDRFLQEAQRIIDRISIGRYDRLVLKDGSEPLLLKKGADTPVPASNASRSVREVLYLSLRLALFSILFPTQTFPLILDDPLLSLDSQRQGSTMSLLREISRGKQVILLTMGNYSVEAGDNAFHL